MDDSVIQSLWARSTRAVCSLRRLAVASIVRLMADVPGSLFQQGSHHIALSAWSCGRIRIRMYCTPLVWVGWSGAANSSLRYRISAGDAARRPFFVLSLLGCLTLPGLLATITMCSLQMRTSAKETEAYAQLEVRYRKTKLSPSSAP